MPAEAAKEAFRPVLFLSIYAVPCLALRSSSDRDLCRFDEDLLYTSAMLCAAFQVARCAYPPGYRQALDKGEVN
jgi:hypothetical protein